MSWFRTIDVPTGENFAQLTASLKEQDRQLLRELSDLGAGTAIELAVRLARKPDDVESAINRLADMSLVEVYSSPGRHPIYAPSLIGRQLISVWAEVPANGRQVILSETH